MAYKQQLQSVLRAIGLISSGVLLSSAWRYQLWGLVTAALLIALWLAVLSWRTALRPALDPSRESLALPPSFSLDRLLLDVAPTPMLAVEGEQARVLNSAARHLFATDDRIPTVPIGLADPSVSHIRHEGRHWRVDRVVLTGPEEGRMVAALVDVKQEESVAEARAIADMIHVLGHELLNGLAPIASLAESGEIALARADPDHDLLAEILSTITRRAEGLQRFTEAYRSLARLPGPSLRPVSIGLVAEGLRRLFEGCWSQIDLIVGVEDGPPCWLDQDQVTQALWALLQNAAEASTAVHGDRAQVALSMSFSTAGLTIDVQDNGDGVSPDDKSRIFRPFHTTKAEGQIAQAHGGRLTLEPLQRTTFRFSIPVESGEYLNTTAVPSPSVRQLDAASVN